MAFFCKKLTKSAVIFTIFAIFVTQLGTSKTQRATQPSREAGYLGGISICHALKYI